MRAIVLPAAALALVGCGAAEVPPERLAVARAGLAKELAPAKSELVTAWLTSAESDAEICGEVSTPRVTLLRFVQIASGPVLVDPGARYRATDGLAAPLLAETAALFDSTWANVCLPAAPLGRRVAAWVDGSPGAERPDTPIGNAYADDVLGKGRAR